MRVSNAKASPPPFEPNRNSPGANSATSYPACDNGVAGALELRFDRALSYDWLTGYQLYGFVDRGTAWNVGFASEHISLSLAGAGVRLHFPAELEADAGIAVPLDYRTLDNESRDPHVYFSLSKSFKLCPDRTRLHCT